MDRLKTLKTIQKIESKQKEIDLLIKSLAVDTENTVKVLKWMENPGLLNIPDAAKMLGEIKVDGKVMARTISAKTLHRILDQGKIEFVMVNKRRHISLTALHDYLKQHTVQKKGITQIIYHDTY